MRRALLAAVVVLATLLQHWTPTLSPRRATPDQPTVMNARRVQQGLSGTAAEGLIQIANQLPDAPSARRCRGVAYEHFYDGWWRAPASLLNVISADISIIAGDEFGRSRRVSRCSENVLHLVGVGQWMQVRSGCRAHRCSRRIARGRGVCVSGRLERRPRGVAQCLPAFAASSERPCGVDRVARAGVGRVCSLEDLQHFLRALSGVTGDLTKVLHAQNDLAGFVRHGYHPRLPHWTPPLSYSADRKSTRLNSSHANISYAVFCLKKKKKK